MVRCNGRGLFYYSHKNNAGESVPTLLGTVPDMESEPALQALRVSKKSI